MVAADQYLETKVMTATPWQLHLMVVDAAIRKATQALEALEKKDYETSHFSLNKSRECITELIGGLNSEQQPELIDQLKALFAFVYRNLAEADLYHDPSRVADAMKVLQTHRETWIALGEELGKEQPAAPAAPHGRSWES